MSSDLTALPATITAGDSYGITLTLSDYPASAGWSVEYVIKGGGGELSATSTASGDAHVLALTIAATSVLAAGAYTYRAKALKGVDTAETFETGPLTVIADLGSLTTSEAQLPAERQLALVEAAIEGTLSAQHRMVMIQGRQLQSFSLVELYAIRDRLKSELARIAAGNVRGELLFASALNRPTPWE